MKSQTPALFLDRDGVINKDFGYVFEKVKFDFFPEIMKISAMAAKQEWPIVVITNQSGIGRGLYTEQDFLMLNSWMIEKFLEHNIEISLVLYAPENPDDEAIQSELRRKPSPAMFFEAASQLQLDLSKSIMIGDCESDMIAASSAGIGHRFLISENHVKSAATKVVENHKECIEELEILFNHDLGGVNNG
jgi:D-glycero-D-manno-heptose 1,7-bisphosphate phosphatase